MHADADPIEASPVLDDLSTRASRTSSGGPLGGQIPEEGRKVGMQEEEQQEEKGRASG